MLLEEAYSILEIEEEVSEEELKEQYRWLVKFYHPDNRITGDPKEFKRVVEAYKTIRGE